MSNYFEELEKQKLKLGKEIKEQIAENEMLYNFKDDVPLNNNKDGMATLMGEIVDRENLTIDEKDRLRRETDIAQLYSNFGDDLTKFLNDDSIIEIYLNQDGFLRIEKFGTGRILTNIRFSPKRAENILKLVASFNSTVITTEQPFISAVLPKGERITGIISNPVGHNPIFTIRKKSNIRFELSYYVKQGVIEEWQKEYLEEKIRNKKNILIAGNTSSGKTTFGNACVEYLERMEKEDLAQKYNLPIEEIDLRKIAMSKNEYHEELGERIAIIEEVAELVCNCTNVLRFTVSQYMSALDLLRQCMRLTPDRIIFGELRKGIEVIELLKAWNSGHDGGISTIHASVEKGAEKALKKLEQYLGELNIDMESQRQLIGESVDVVVGLARIKTPNGYVRRLVNIMEVEEYDSESKEYITNTIFDYNNKKVG